MVDPPAPRSAFIAATRMHDNGWRESDAHPLLDQSSHAPHSYRTMPDAPYLDVWQRGIARAVAVDAWTGLLVSLHGARFLRTERSQEMRRFAEAEAARRQGLLAHLGFEAGDELPPQVARASDWVAFLDGLSLFFCGEWGETMDSVVDGVTHHAARTEANVTVDPFPFDRAFELEVPALRLPRLRDEAALSEAMAAATRHAVRRSVRPA